MSVPLRMCEACHERGKVGHYKDQPHGHDYVAIGNCGQCGQLSLLIECHTYDFRRTA